MIETLSRKFNNEAALQSSVYNPEISQDTAGIYAMMAEPDEQVLEQYREIVLTMPTSNPFVGVLNNPQSCDIAQVSTDLQEVKAALEELHELVKQTAPAPDVYEWQVSIPVIYADIVTAEETMEEMQDHTDRLVANLPTVVGMAQSSSGIQNSMANAASLASGVAGGVGALLGVATSVAALLGPCLPVQGFLGSLMERGSALLGRAGEFVGALKDNVMGAINEIKDGVMGTVNSMFSGLKDALGSIKSVMNSVMGTVSNIKSMIQEEISNMVGGLLNMARMGLAELLGNLKLDPCLSGIVGHLTGGRLG